MVTKGGINMTKKEEKMIEIIMEDISKIRKYKYPKKDSIIAEEFLRSIPENYTPNNKLIIDDEYLFQTMEQFKYIKKKQGEGYIPSEELLNNGMLEVRECFIITERFRRNNTLYFTPIGQEFFKTIVLNLINAAKTPLRSE